MTEAEGHVREDGTAGRSSFPPPLSHRERFPVQKNNVCSRSYFVVVMVFFHVYILNVIALLLYVHYNTGSDAGASSSRDFSSRMSPPEAPGQPAPHSHSDSHTHLPRIEGIRVRICFPSSLHSIKAPCWRNPALLSDGCIIFCHAIHCTLWGLISHWDVIGFKCADALDHRIPSLILRNTLSCTFAVFPLLCHLFFC